MESTSSSEGLAASITRAASLQTYITIRFLADRDRAADAYRAYAYFRWVDDTLDAPGGEEAGRQEFLRRQQSLLAGCYRNEFPAEGQPEEEMLRDLVLHDPDIGSGLHTYLNNMMKVMAFDAGRRGRLISAAELSEYTHNLASSVTEAMHYFIGHNCTAPQDETRYLAVNAAHITHMLRDTLDDLKAGYYNIPCEVLEANDLTPGDVQADPYRDWVESRVRKARQYFSRGRDCMRRVQNLRCRLASLAYVSRFEGVLRAIEKDGFILRESYPEQNALSALGSAMLALMQGFAVRTPSRQTPDRGRSLRRS